MNKLFVFDTKAFNGISCNIYISEGDNDDFWMTRNQVGQALGYMHPDKAIQRIHKLYKNCFEHFSMKVNMHKSNKTIKTVIYSSRGLNELCYRSRKAISSKFAEWLHGVKQDVHDRSTITFEEMHQIINTRLELSISFDNFMDYLTHAFYVSSGRPTQRSLDLEFMNKRGLNFGITPKGMNYFINRFKNKYCGEEVI